MLLFPSTSPFEGVVGTAEHNPASKPRVKTIVFHMLLG
jgi:hypothetical protein